MMKTTLMMTHAAMTASRLLAVACVFWACQTGDLHDPTTLATTEQAQQGLRICAQGETVRGIDVSRYQGDIDWDAVAADGVEFAFIRVSDGVDYIDEYFEQNWDEAGRAGVMRGVYQYFRSGDDVAAQAQILLERMGEIGPGVLPPVIDVENLDNGSAALLWTSVLEWIEIIEQATGVKPILYTYPYFWQSHSIPGDWSDYLLWIANYDVDCPDVPDDWDNWTFFQYTSSGRVPGIDGNVDLNYFNGSYDDLLALTNLGEACESIPATGAVIDVNNRCFDLQGPRQYWRQASGGYGGGPFYWTNATDNESAVNSAKWYLDFEQAGRYGVQVYVAEGRADSVQAPYQIQTRTQDLTVVANQSEAAGWLSLGHFDFDEGPNQWVRVDDNSGEPNDGEMRIVADAIRIVPVSVETSDMGIDPMTDGGMAPITDAGMAPTDMDEPIGDGSVNDRQRPDAGPPLLSDDTDEEDEGDSVLDSVAPSGVRAEGSSGCSIATLPDVRSLLCLGVVALLWRRRRS